MTLPARRLHGLASIVCAAAVLAAAGAAATAVDAARVQAPVPSAGDQAVYWCPMHPDVRGRAGDKCPRCGMTLVRAAAADYRAYLLDLDIAPRALRPKQAAHVRFVVRDPRTGAVVRQFALVHERVFHLFVVSQDLEYFAHIHPALGADGSLGVDLVLPRAGVYQLIADFTPAGGPTQLVQKSIVTAGYTGSLLGSTHLAPDTADRTAGATRVKLSMPEPLAGREQLVTFELEDARTGAPVDDLEPYLGAVGHMLIASADLQAAAHSHPVAEISAPGGPTIVFQVLFPKAGDYRMWVQFQRHGEVFTVPFTVPVKGRY